MSTEQTTLFPPPNQSVAVRVKRNKNSEEDDGYFTKTQQLWQFTLQNQLPLRQGDTTAGPYSEALPPAGLNATTGQSNQNQEIIYIKTSADGNGWTITGAITGSVTLTAQYSVARFKSDGTNWLKV